MKILSAQQVKNKMERNPQAKVVMTLGPKAYAKSHIPGSINIWNITLAKEQFSQDTEIIGYCSDQRCMASYYAYQQLAQAGFNNIWRFAGGLNEWSDAGYPLEATA